MNGKVALVTGSSRGIGRAAAVALAQAGSAVAINYRSQEGITVNAVNPALIETDMVIGNPHVSPEMVPIGRFGTADEISAVVLLLARNGYITGQSFSVNAGMYFT